ncbi:hypothetical protein DFS34DRAFT_650736 [Phlyctochytrium arcticum]|nr:hypothetical protein DFS34DRAFT_650736 [Phlyctochytrium arcticum]
MPSLLSRFYFPAAAKLPSPKVPKYRRPQPEPVRPPHFNGIDPTTLPNTEEDVVLSRLPSEHLKPSQEYPQLVLGRTRKWPHMVERGKRKFAFVVDKLTGQPGAMVFLGVTMGGVYGLGVYEALLNVHHGVPIGEVWRFIMRFATANTFCAFVNSSVAAETVASSLKMDLSLFHFVPNSTDDIISHYDNVYNAEARLNAMYARAARGLAAGYMGVAMLLRVINWTLVASNVYRERVLAASEPLFSGVEGRVFRLCGRVSDTLTVSLAKEGEHILPIIENPTLIRPLLQEHTKKGSIPIAWHIRENQYGSPLAYAGLTVDEPSLLKTKTGERLLYLEADGTNSEDALRLGTHSADLSLDDASAAFRMIEDVAERSQGLPDFSTIRVFLGDTLQKSQTGGGVEFSLRQRVRFRHEVDILIDSKTPILTEIIKWADKNAAPGWHGRQLVFETDSQEYFHNLSALLNVYGFTVMDISQVSSETSITLPRLIYYRRTGSTVNAFRAILDADPIDPGRVCVVIDTKEGLDTVQQLTKRGYLSAGQTTIVCSGEIYDSLFRQVRTWCRMGYTPKQIQEELDARNAYVSQMAKTIAQKAEEAKKKGELKDGEFAEDNAEKEKEAERAAKDDRTSEASSAGKANDDKS